MLTESISRNAVLLGIFSVVSTIIISATFLNTTEKISENIRYAEEKALLDIVPITRHNNSMLDDVQQVDDSVLLGLREPKKLYVAKQNNTPIAVIIPATARDGYTGDIDLIVGINVDGTIAGVRVLSHRETPGLGDAIDKLKSDWVEGFNNKSLHNPEINQWKVKKDQGVFDQFTGATITPRAVTKAVLQTLHYFEQNQYNIFNQHSTNRQPSSIQPSSKQTSTVEKNTLKEVVPHG